MTHRSAISIFSIGCILLWYVGGANAGAGDLCSHAWYKFIEEKVVTGDGHGHGPDVGSAEWKSVVEFKLGIRGNPDVPSRESDDWCRYIDETVRIGKNTSGGATNVSAKHPAAGPSFPCENVRSGSIEALICQEAELAVLDRKLSAVYADASQKAADQHPPVLQAEQRGWIKGRNDCWKSDDRYTCVREAYQRRIAELQAMYRLVPFTGPVRYVCDGSPTKKVIATYFQTEPPTLIAEHGDSVSLMYLRKSASGARYQGRNESLWEHHGEATIVWGFGAPEMQCKKAPSDGG